MLKKNIKKILAILMLLIIAISNMQGIVMAKEIGDSAKLVKIGDCNLNVQFKFDSGWSDVKGRFTKGGMRANLIWVEIPLVILVIRTKSS